MVSFCTPIASLQPQQAGRSHTHRILSQSLSGWGVTSPCVTLAFTFWPAQCARWWRMESLRHMAVSPAAIRARQPHSHPRQSHWRARSLLIRGGDCQLHWLYISGANCRRDASTPKDVFFFVLFCFYGRKPRWSRHLSSLLLLLPLLMMIKQTHYIGRNHSRLPSRDGQTAKAAHARKRNLSLSALIYIKSRDPATLGSVVLFANPERRATEGHKVNRARVAVAANLSLRLTHTKIEA